MQNDITLFLGFGQMRFRDFIVNQAIKTNYREKILNKCDNAVISSIYTKLSDNLGYKIMDMVLCKNRQCSHQEWAKILERFAYDKSTNPKRFLEYNTERRRSYYFSENGVLYTGINGIDFEIVYPSDDKELYEKHRKFLDYAIIYYNHNVLKDKQYMMIGFNDKHRYYLCTDGKFYYTLGKGSYYKECTKRLNEYCTDLLMGLK